MKVANLISKDVQTCRPIDSLAQAAELMWDHDLALLPVVDEQGHVVGTVTDNDTRMSAYFRSLPMHLISVGSIMTAHPPTCSLDDEAETVSSRLRDGEIAGMPVVDDEGHAVGVVSLTDLAHAVERESSASPSGRGA